MAHALSVAPGDDLGFQNPVPAMAVAPLLVEETTESRPRPEAMIVMGAPDELERNDWELLAYLLLGSLTPYAEGGAGFKATIDGRNGSWTGVQLGLGKALAGEPWMCE